MIDWEKELTNLMICVELNHSALIEKRITEKEYLKNIEERKNMVLSTLKSLKELPDSGNENKLREILWATHPCQGKYGDDGELQCGACGIDFKRMSPNKIEEIIIIKGLKELAKQGMKVVEKLDLQTEHPLSLSANLS
jgi:hypothetical protein